MATLEIDRLNKTYGTVRALRDMSFTVGAGEIFGFVGSNGAGKTTTMRIALGVLAPDSGEVRWDGRPLDLAMRRRIGYMPEERGLYPKMKVGDQLVYLARLHGLGTAAARSAMEHWTQVLGIDARRGDEVQKLSLGNQQRVQLAAALVHDPDILVLDEPFSGLDPVAVDVMSGVLRDRAAAGVPVVFSSHQLDLVERLCDRVGIVKAGEMVEVGGIEELRSTQRPQWVVDAPAAPPGWASELPGVRVLRYDGARTFVEVDSPQDGAEQAVLRAALATGPVREFTPQRPSLTELFRHVVSSDEAPPCRRVGRRRPHDPLDPAGGLGMSAVRQPPAQQPHSPVSTWGAVSLVAGREISTRIRSKAFVWTTVALLVGVVLGGFLLSVVGDQGPAAQKVGVTSGAEALGPQLEAAGRRGRHRDPGQPGLGDRRPGAGRRRQASTRS